MLELLCLVLCWSLVGSDSTTTRQVSLAIRLDRSGASLAHPDSFSLLRLPTASTRHSATHDQLPRLPFSMAIARYLPICGSTPLALATLLPSRPFACLRALLFHGDSKDGHSQVGCTPLALASHSLTAHRELSLFARVKCNDLCAVSLSSSFRALARTYVAHSLALSISVVSCSLRAVYELRLGARVVQAMSACNWLTLPAAEDALLIAA